MPYASSEVGAVCLLPWLCPFTPLLGGASATLHNLMQLLPQHCPLLSAFVWGQTGTLCALQRGAVWTAATHASLSTFGCFMHLFLVNCIHFWMSVYFNDFGNLQYALLHFSPCCCGKMTSIGPRPILYSFPFRLYIQVIWLAVWWSRINYWYSSSQKIVKNKTKKRLKNKF